MLVPMAVSHSGIFPTRKALKAEQAAHAAAAGAAPPAPRPQAPQLSQAGPWHGWFSGSAGGTLVEIPWIYTSHPVTVPENIHHGICRITGNWTILQIDFECNHPWVEHRVPHPITVAKV